MVNDPFYRSPSDRRSDGDRSATIRRPVGDQNLSEDCRRLNGHRHWRTKGDTVRYPHPWLARGFVHNVYPYMISRQIRGLQTAQT